MREFEAGGKTYKVNETISVARFNKYQEMQVELLYGMDMEQMVKNMQQIIQINNNISLNGTLRIKDITDVNSIAYNTLRGIENIGKEMHPALKICTLFVNTDDENVGDWDESLARQKVEDWKEIDMSFFLNLALSSISNFKENYKEAQAFLEQNQDLKE